MTKDEFDVFVKHRISEIFETKASGQAEYALNEDAFDNFNRLAAELKLDRKKVLMIYFSKHRDGVMSFLNGHISQREPVDGRIKDMIVYLFLLWGMVWEEARDKKLKLRNFIEIHPGVFYRKTSKCGPHADTDFCSTCERKEDSTSKENLSAIDKLRSL